MALFRGSVRHRSGTVSRESHVFEGLQAMSEPPSNLREDAGEPIRPDKLALVVRFGDASQSRHHANVCVRRKVITACHDSKYRAQALLVAAVLKRDHRGRRQRPRVGEPASCQS
jgi:hypothetical protein